MTAPARLPRAFWWLWTSSAASNLADGVLKTALPLVALGFTTSPAAVAGLSLALSLPWLVVALPAGALVDRWDRRATLVVADVARAVVVALLTVVTLTGGGSMAALYAAAVLVGVAEVFRDTTAQSVLPQVVGRDALPAANGRLHAAELTTNAFAGPPLGGVLVGVGAAVALGAPAGLWALAVLALLQVRGSFRAPRAVDAPRTTLRRDIGEGLRFLWRRPVLRTLAVMVGVTNLAMSAVSAVFVLWAVGARSAMGLTEAQYGVLLMWLAVGAVGGSLVAGPVTARLGRTATLGVSVVGSALCLAAPAVTTDPLLVGAANTVAGFGIALWNVVTVSLRQRLTPDHLLGRVNSAYRLLAWGTMPLGAALGGLIGETWGLRWVFVVGGVVAAGLVVLLPRVGEGALVAAERAAQEDGVRGSDDERAADGTTDDGPTDDGPTDDGRHDDGPPADEADGPPDVRP
ncbi:MAG: MFS transporter [Cellulomonas iranensis]|uniref:MFS transporter n=1 Tax=Cellulomonas iranensis TaxID=76862 RepID=UPI001178C24A|nr:MFS transporter [Cellulomonas iranensis]MBO9568582.1 MFS transporter [Cellulomonas iranensis]